jgi:hypothetical protein
MPPKKMSPNIGADIGAITGILLRLDPQAVSSNWSGVTTTPLDGVSVLLIREEIF